MTAYGMLAVGVLASTRPYLRHIDAPEPEGTELEGTELEGTELEGTELEETRDEALALSVGDA